jgi:hypothetical protein
MPEEKKGYGLSGNQSRPVVSDRCRAFGPVLQGVLAVWEPQGMDACCTGTWLNPWLRCCSCASLQCFVHFNLYLKGREELVVTIYSGKDAASRAPEPIFRALKLG